MTLRELINNCCGRSNSIECPELLKNLEILYDTSQCLFPIMRYFLSYKFTWDQRTCLLDLEDYNYNRLNPYLLLNRDKKDGEFFMKIKGESFEEVNEQ